MSPGTTVFHDGKTREENDDLEAVLTPAAVIMTRVVSHPNNGQLSATINRIRMHNKCFDVSLIFSGAGCFVLLV